MRRGCATCWAWFEKSTDKETLKVLKEHLEKCTKENPYRDDPNADGYDDY